MSVAKTIYTATRPTWWPAPAGTTVTVEARLQGDVVGITWSRSDHPEAFEHISLTLTEFNGIAAAIAKEQKR